MQSKEYLKIKARKIAKQTWAGPGKFGVFIILCIIVVATFEGLGLSNRERNLEMRTVPHVAPVIIKATENKVNEFSEQIIQSDQLNKKIKLSSLEDNKLKSQSQNQILLMGALIQQEYESDIFDNIKNEMINEKSFNSFKMENIENKVNVEEDFGSFFDI